MPMKPKLKKILITGALSLLVAGSAVGLFSYTHSISYNPSTLVIAKNNRRRGRRSNHLEREMNQDRNARKAAKHDRAFTINGVTFHYEGKYTNNNTGVGNDSNWKSNLSELEKIGRKFGFSKPTANDKNAANGSRDYYRTLFHAYEDGLYDHVSGSYVNHQMNDITNDSNARHNKPIDLNGHKIFNENQGTYHGSVNRLRRLARKDGYNISNAKMNQYKKWYRDGHYKESKNDFLKHCIEDGTYEHAKGVIKRGQQIRRQRREQGRIIHKCHNNSGCIGRQDRRLHIRPSALHPHHHHNGSHHHHHGSHQHYNGGNGKGAACKTGDLTSSSPLQTTSNVAGNQLVANDALSKYELKQHGINSARAISGNADNNYESKTLPSSAEGTVKKATGDTWKKLMKDILNQSGADINKNKAPGNYLKRKLRHNGDRYCAAPSSKGCKKWRHKYYYEYKYNKPNKNNNYFYNSFDNKHYKIAAKATKNLYDKLYGLAKPMGVGTSNNHGKIAMEQKSPSGNTPDAAKGFNFGLGYKKSPFDSKITGPEPQYNVTPTSHRGDGVSLCFPTYGGPDGFREFHAASAHSMFFGSEHNSYDWIQLQNDSGPGNKSIPDIYVRLPDSQPSSQIKVEFPYQAKYIPEEEKYDVQNNQGNPKIANNLGISLTPYLTISDIQYYHPWFGIDSGQSTAHSINISKNFAHGLRTNGITSMHVQYNFKFTPTSGQQNELNKLGLHIGTDSLHSTEKTITNGNEFHPDDASVEDTDGQNEKQSNSGNWYLSLGHLSSIKKYSVHAGDSSNSSSCQSNNGGLNPTSNEKYVQSTWHNGGAQHGDALYPNDDKWHANLMKNLKGGSLGANIQLPTPASGGTAPTKFNPSVSPTYDDKSHQEKTPGKAKQATKPPKNVAQTIKKFPFWSKNETAATEMPMIWRMIDPSDKSPGWIINNGSTYDTQDPTGEFAQPYSHSPRNEEYAFDNTTSLINYKSQIFNKKYVIGGKQNSSTAGQKDTSIFRFPQAPKLDATFGSGTGYGTLIPSTNTMPNNSSAPLSCIYNRWNEKPQFSIGSGNYENGSSDISGKYVGHGYSSKHNALIGKSATELETGGYSFDGHSIPSMSKTDAQAIAGGGTVTKSSLENWVQNQKCTIPCNDGHCPQPKIPAVKKSVGVIHHTSKPITDKYGKKHNGGQLEYPSQVYTYYLSGVLPQYPHDNKNYTQHGYTADWRYNGSSWYSKPSNRHDYYEVVDNLPKEVSVVNAKLVRKPLEDKDDNGTYNTFDNAKPDIKWPTKTKNQSQQVTMNFKRDNGYGGPLAIDADANHSDSQRAYCLAITVKADNLPQPTKQGWYKYWNGINFGSDDSNPYSHNGAYTRTNYGQDNSWRENPINIGDTPYKPNPEGNTDLTKNNQFKEGNKSGTPARENFNPVPVEIKKLRATIYHYDYNNKENLHNNHFPDVEEPFGFAGTSDNKICSDPGNTHESETGGEPGVNNESAYPIASHPDNGHNNGSNYSDSVNYKEYKFRRFFNKNSILHTSHIVGYVGSNVGVRFLNGYHYYKDGHDGRNGKQLWAYRSVYPGLEMNKNKSGAVYPNKPFSDTSDPYLIPNYSRLANESAFQDIQNVFRNDWKNEDKSYMADSYQGNRGVPVRMNPDCGNAYSGNPDTGSDSDFEQVNYFPYIVPRINIPASPQRGGDKNKVPTPHTHHNPNYNPDDRGDNSNNSQIGKHPIDERLVIDTDKKSHGLPFRMDMRVQNFINERHFFRDFRGDNVTMTIKSHGTKLYQATRPLVKDDNLGTQESNKASQHNKDLAHLRDTYVPGTGWKRHDITNDEWPNGDLHWQGYIQRDAFEQANKNNPNYNLHTENARIGRNHHLPVTVSFKTTNNETNNHSRQTRPTERVTEPTLHSKAYVASRNRIRSGTFNNNRAHFIRPERTIEYFSSRPYNPRILYEEVGVNQPRNGYAKTGYGMTGNDFGIYYMGHLQSQQYAHKGSSIDYAFPRQFNSADTNISYSKDPRGHKFHNKLMLVDGLLHVKPRFTPTDPSVSDNQAGQIEYENKNNAKYHDDNGENYGLPDYLDSDYNNNEEMNADYYFDKCFPEGIISGIYSSIYGFYPRMSYHNTKGIDRRPEGEIAIAKNNRWRPRNSRRYNYSTHRGFGDQSDNGSGYSFYVTGNKQEQTNNKESYQGIPAENITDDGQNERMFTPKFMRLGLYKVIFEKAYNESGKGSRAHRLGSNFFDIDEDRPIHFYAHQYIAKNSRSKDQDEFSLQPILTNPHGLNQVSTSSPLFPDNWLSGADNHHNIGHSWKSLTRATGL